MRYFDDPMRKVNIEFANFSQMEKKILPMLTL